MPRQKSPQDPVQNTATETPHDQAKHATAAFGARAFFAAILGTALFIYTVVGAFNIIVDPYGIRDWPGRWSWNSDKPLAIYHDRITKSAMIGREPFDCVVSGNSRISEGIPLDHPFFSGCKAVRDLSLAGSSFAEQRQFLEATYRQQPISLSLVGLDYLNFNVHRRPTRGFQPSLLANGWSGDAARYASTAFSLDTFYDSRATLTRQGTPSFLLTNGSANEAFLEQAQKARTSRGQAMATMWGYIGHDLAMPAYDFSLVSPSHNPLADFRAFLDLEHRSKRRVALIINPVHAWMLENVHAMGFSNLLQSWKRQLVAINEAAASAAGQQPFPLIDFSGHNQVTTEPIPRDDTSVQPLKFFWDPSHFKRHVGAMMLDRLLYSDDKADGFGVHLTAATIEAHLRGEHSAAIAWRADNAHDVEDIHAIVACLAPPSHRNVDHIPSRATCRRTVTRAW